jgi:XTP/dITP diphosphohydrolase
LSAPYRARLASRNAHKARELEALLPGWEIEPLDRDDYPPEDGGTYLDNARIKAQFARAVLGPIPGVWALGEDSGIEVEALGGAPGPQSARSAQGDEVGWVLHELGGSEDRRARYVSELVAISPKGEELRGSGTLEGAIAFRASGAEGFGFDPVFVPSGESRTVASLGNEWKSRNSHRARAAQSLLNAIAERA